jgi:formate dehydrogenase beta subunit
MPADAEEITAAEQEGIIFHFLANPSRIVSDDGRVSGVELLKMRQTEPDASGRRKVQPIAGTESTLPCTVVIAAIGQEVRKGALTPADGVKLNKWGYVQADESTCVTTREGVFAGGDAVSGPATLIHAMSAGLHAARTIDDYLQLGHVRFAPRSRMRQILNTHKMLASDSIEYPVRSLHRVHHPELQPEVRKLMFEEVEGTISSEDAYHEASRCMRCYRIYSVITDLPIPQGNA